MAMANVVQVEVRSVYGASKIYPVCERSKLLAELAGSKQLTPQAVALIKRHNAIALTLDAACAHAAAAREALQTLPANAYREALEALPEFVVERAY